MRIKKIIVIILTFIFSVLSYIFYDEVNRGIDKKKYNYIPHNIDFSLLDSLMTLNDRVEFIKVDTIGSFDFGYKWVGGILASNGKVYAMPNHSRRVLVIDVNNRTVSQIGNLSSSDFKYTGGGISSNGKIYGFPRSASSLLEINPNTDEVKEIKLKRSIYRRLKNKICVDHHYGGCIIGELAYLAPRQHNTIMIVDVSTGATEEVETPKGLRFSGVVYHPNGNIYFVPDKWSRAKKKIMKFNPRTREFSFFNDTISGSCFGLIVHPKDSCIYSFSANSSGILKIDVKNETAQMLHKEIGTGWYGTKLGWNGKIYSICGNSSKIMEYNPITDSLTMVGEIYAKEGWMDYNEAKCAGGAVMPDGSILAVPALGRHIYLYKFDKFKTNIDSNIYTSVYYNNY